MSAPRVRSLTNGSASITPVCAVLPVLASVRLEIIDQRVGVASGESRARREAGQIAGLFLPDLQLVQRQVLPDVVAFVQVEQEFPVDDALGGAVGAVANDERNVGQEDRVIVGVAV